MTRSRRSNNFFEKECGKNDTYNFNRSHPSRQDVRAYCSKLLEHHWNYCADTHFQEDAVENPQQRWWEMYISWILFSKNIGGFKGIKVDGEGPDFCFVLPCGKRIWVEAIAVKPGIGDNEVKRPAEGQVGHLPVDKMVLRFTSAFTGKAQKIQTYIDKKIINNNDAVVIAINTGEMRDSDLADQYPPLAVRALLGIGEMAFKVSIHPDAPSLKPDDVGVVFPEQKQVKKTSQTQISTEGFSNYKTISGVFTSTSHLVDMMDEGKDLKILLNPYARNPLDKSLFKFGTIISKLKP